MAHWIRHYQRFLQQRGPLNSTLIVTVTMTISSAIVTALLALLLDPRTFSEMVMIGVLVPLVLAPPVGYSMALLVHDLSRAHAALQRVADRDMLTDAFTRRYFMTTVTERLTAAGETGAVDSVVLVDIDDFKRINDTHGHPTGDAVLKAISLCCREHLREQDVFARYGGEEFVILVGGASPASALVIIERVRLAIRALRVAAPSGQFIVASASFGIAGSRDPGLFDPTLSAANRLERLLAAADQALYEAKHSGKNRAVIAAPLRPGGDLAEHAEQAG